MRLCDRCIKNEVCRYNIDGSNVQGCRYYRSDGVERMYKVTMRYCTEVVASIG
ncbi:hypothetical protein FACS1894200_12920 [Spirochaetia bacterium]|nr:hypothetical protein FACS1894200_12920 [Spirochaetia bacterium]